MIGALSLLDLDAGYGDVQIIHGLSAIFPIGRVSAVLGPGGSGKSTLLRVLAREPVDGLWWRAARPSPEHSGLSWRLAQTERGCPLFKPAALGIARRAIRAWVALRPSCVEHRSLDALVGNELTCVRVAQLLSTPATLLLLDEADTHACPPALKALAGLIRQLSREGKTTVLVSHNLAFARSCADHALVMIDGEKLDEGPIQHMQDHSRSQRVRDFFVWGG